MIEAKGVTVRYGEVVAVDRVDLTVDKGEIVGVIGPNGAGKTTLLECLEGLRRPDAGEIRVGGIDPRVDRDRMARIAGVQLQHSAYPPRASVDDVCRLFAGFYPDGAGYPELLEQFGLTGHRKKQVAKLSGGQQQRLSLALALLGRPDVVFLDELTTGLDPAARRVIWEELRRRNNDGLTILLTSHHMEEIEYLCDRVAVLVKGRFVATGSPTELVREHAGGGDRLMLEGVAADTALRAQLTALAGVSVTPAGNRLLVRAEDAGSRERVDEVLADRGIAARPLAASLEDVYLTLSEEQTHVH
ncbi:ABC transporter ATP-binding protein [Polymorphospora rubra]|uniref:ABC transporter ATP-binding protein n=2 Tax=Polymorphospora rubra TaxID=338584 RepID=UPI0031DBD5CD